jgi:hypothetical protein
VKEEDVPNAATAGTKVKMRDSNTHDSDSERMAQARTWKKCSSSSIATDFWKFDSTQLHGTRSARNQYQVKVMIDMASWRIGARFVAFTFCFVTGL